MPLPGLGPNCPGGPERGEPSLCGQSQAAKQGDTEMPPCSLEEGVLEYLDGYTVWAEARTRPCPLPRRSAGQTGTSRAVPSGVECDWEQQGTWSLWVREAPAPASAECDDAVQGSFE